MYDYHRVQLVKVVFRGRFSYVQFYYLFIYYIKENNEKKDNLMMLQALPALYYNHINKNKYYFFCFNYYAIINNYNISNLY